MAKQEEQLCLDKLASVSPTDVETIMELQSAVKMCRNFEQWLVELIDKGTSALEIWRNGQTDK